MIPLLVVDADPNKLGLILPERYDFLPDITAYSLPQPSHKDF